MSRKYDKEILTRIIELIESTQKLPWQCGYLKEGLPYNFTSGREYSGRNLIVLFMARYNRGGFLTEKQINRLGGTIREDEISYPVIFFKPLTVNRFAEENEDTESVSSQFCRLYRVYNVAQVDNLPNLDARVNKGQNRDVEDFLQRIHMKIYYGKCPHYVPSSDIVNIPAASDYINEGEYYSSLFHECIHWTGNKSRLNRTQKTYFGSEEYSYEELVAELGSAFLRGHFQIATPDNIQNSAEYIRNWLKIFKSDTGILFRAASDAQKAVRYLFQTAEIA